MDVILVWRACFNETESVRCLGIDDPPLSAINILAARWFY